jgi:hypothetical protein
MKSRKLVQSAHHEAAHAVVLYRTAGHAGSHVTIVPKQKKAWIELGSAHDGLSDSLDPGDMESTILSLYAGGHAQRELKPACGREGCDGDEEGVEDLLARHGWKHREQELRERSLTLTRRHWAEIVAVAKELLRVRVLDGTEIEAISDAAAGDPDAILDLARYRALKNRTKQEQYGESR